MLLARFGGAQGGVFAKARLRRRGLLGGRAEERDGGFRGARCVLCVGAFVAAEKAGAGGLRKTDRLFKVTARRGILACDGVSF